VLEEFQTSKSFVLTLMIGSAPAMLTTSWTGKELEIRSAVERMEHQLETAKKSLAEYQERATVAEVSWSPPHH
jgi:hypothetical protein